VVGMEVCHKQRVEIATRDARRDETLRNAGTAIDKDVDGLVPDQ